MYRWRPFSVIWILVWTTVLPGRCGAQDEYATDIQPLLQKYCFECHSADLTEAEIDLGEFKRLADLKQDVAAWVKVRHILDSRQMPPKDSAQPTDEERTQLTHWVRGFLAEEAKANAGDPGEVMLRRLSNAEYTYSIQDLTGIDSLDPTSQFPVDGAAGEGFTNTGSGLVMSPSLVQKYLDAGKEIANHAAFFPDGLRFSKHTSRRDLTDELLTKIRSLYFRYSVSGMDAKGTTWGGSSNFDNEQAGLLPLTKYLQATIELRQALRDGTTTIAEVARSRELSAPYLQKLWDVLSATSNSDSFLLQRIRQQWATSSIDDVEQLTTTIAALQPAFWKFNVVGHLGREGAPQQWMAPITPVTSRLAFRLPLKPENGQDVVVQLIADNAGDGHDEHDFVFWRDLQLEKPGESAILLRDAMGIYERATELQLELVTRIADYLAAASDVDENTDASAAATKHDVKLDLLRVLLKYLGVASDGPATITGHFQNQIRNNNYNFVKGWGADATPLVLANSSDQQVRIPGISEAHSLVVHPSPTEYVAVVWQSPVTGVVKVDASISDAHPECGNGVEWALQQQGNGRMTALWNGEIPTAQKSQMESKTVKVTKGEAISFLVGPRQGNHSCDLTAIHLTIAETTGENRTWDVAKDCSPNIVEANPHSDRYDNKAVWHFCSGPMAEMQSLPGGAPTVPADSLLARWRDNPDQRPVLAAQINQLLSNPQPPANAESPDGLLYQQVRSLQLDLNSSLFANVKPDARFGTHALGHTIQPDHIVVKAPNTLEFRIPASLAEGRELVLAGMHDVTHGLEGTTRINAVVGTNATVPADAAIICADNSEASKRIARNCDDFRNLFPPALCYTRIVPVDEVVTSILYYREDGLYRELMLTDAEAGELDRLWQELFYVSEEPLKAVVALEQIREFSTQDRQDLVSPWDKLKPVVAARADEFRSQVIASEPNHLESVLQIANSAWRRPLSVAEQNSLTELYDQLRTSELNHEDAIRLVLARVLTSPSFLYRRETPGETAATQPVSDLELANRLSYFLWSSMPDEQLRIAAEQNRLASGDGELLVQAERMLGDAKTRRLAIHFACQWLHLQDFDQNDDKNESLYPQFGELRGPMYEETVRFFEDMFRNNGSILDLLDAKHTFVNEALAAHYGMEGVTGANWRRVDNVRANGRGGILTMASFLASQSGASRTSPILRGNWLSETLLGEKLPKPPANVPQLPEGLPDGLTERQLIERHSSDPACAKCHARIDPYGFALEQFDAIGRMRSEPADTKTTLYSGTRIDGVDGLRQYLLTERRDDVVRHFCRKLLGFALSREVQLTDEPLLDEMTTTLAANGYRFHTAVEMIVLSKQFRQIRGTSESL